MEPISDVPFLAFYLWYLYHHSGISKFATSVKIDRIRAQNLWFQDLWEERVEI